MNDQIKYYQDKLDYQWDSADLFKNLETRTDIVVIDTRKEFAYELEHIPSSINFPHPEMEEASTSNMNRSKIYVCYCDGIGCNGSTKGSLKMTKLGFNTRELVGGLDWWKRDGYSTEGENATIGTEVQCAC